MTTYLTARAVWTWGWARWRRWVWPTAQRPPLTGALLVKHSAAEKMALVTRAAKLRRTQRAQERCAACSRKRALAQTKAPDRPPALSRSTGNVGGTLSGEP
jgi:hypothetical protein